MNVTRPSKLFPLFLRRGSFLACLGMLPTSTSAASDEQSVARSADNSAPLLSTYAQSVLDVITQPAVIKRSPTVKSLILTHGNSVEKILIDGPNIYSEFANQLAEAKHSIDIAFYKWDEDSRCAKLLGNGIRRIALTSGKSVVVRIMVSDSTLPFSGRSINNLYNSIKKWQIPGSRVRFQLATYPYKALGALHEKIIVIDGATLLLTGANPEKQHDDAKQRWHDSGYVIKGGVALAAQSSFDESWNAHAKHWVCKPRRFQHDCQGERHPNIARPWLRNQDTLQNGTTMISKTFVCRSHISCLKIGTPEAGQMHNGRR